MQNDIYERFVERVREFHRAQSIESLLAWDQETYMPRRAAADRANQMALIAGVAHEKLTSSEMGLALSQLQDQGVGEDGDHVAATNVREMRRLHDRAVKLPTPLVQRIARVSALAKQAWQQAKRDSDFAAFAPYLGELVDLKREVAERIGYDTEPYDALMDEFEPGARAADVQTVFNAVKAELVPLVAAIRDARRQPDISILQRGFPIPAQAAFSRRVVEAFGFDFERGRVDTSTHPFCSGFSPADVRLTTRYDEKWLPACLFSLMHEAGHGMYEQGFDPEHTGTPMAWAVSLGVHESQSRLWENMVGRGRPFWEFWYPRLQAEFPVLSDAGLDEFHFAVNAVRPSFIRVEADEVTYNLHIMLRFDIERRMIAGQLAVNDIPEVWNTTFKEYLGLTPPDDARGCLQDIHWSLAIFGYFPTYALGNLIAAQLYDAARRALPDIDDQFRRGEFRDLREWLREKVHRQGMRYRGHELVREVASQPLSHRPFLSYLKAKFSPLYGLPG